MFPVEDVRAIFEIKSTLTKVELKDALLKMAEQKKIRTFSDSDRIKDKSFKHGNTRLGTFLVCNKFDFQLTADSVNDIMQTYVQNKIHPEYWHNGILSLEDGIIMYVQPEIHFESTNPKTVEEYQKILKKNVGAKVPTNYCWVESKPQLFTPNVNKSTSKEDIAHIETFFACVNTYIHTWCEVSSHDPITYLGIGFIY
jgi:hypothetical protein